MKPSQRHRAYAWAALMAAMDVEGARADEAPKTQPEPTQAQPEAMSKYCARADESIEARIARLETALRLARAELVVNRRRNAKGR